jgi:hypothetical protein
MLRQPAMLQARMIVGRARRLITIEPGLSLLSTNASEAHRAATRRAQFPSGGALGLADTTFTIGDAAMSCKSLAIRYCTPVQALVGRQVALAKLRFVGQGDAATGEAGCGPVRWRSGVEIDRI